eukprot:scaffold130909_cov26-Tisochrysis_lutea.AAC.1
MSAIASTVGMPHAYARRVGCTTFVKYAMRSSLSPSGGSSSSPRSSSHPIARSSRIECWKSWSSRGVPLRGRHRRAVPREPKAPRSSARESIAARPDRLCTERFGRWPKERARVL